MDRLLRLGSKNSYKRYYRAYSLLKQCGIREHKHDNLLRRGRELSASVGNHLSSPTRRLRLSQTLKINSSFPNSIPGIAPFSTKLPEDDFSGATNELLSPEAANMPGMKPEHLETDLTALRKETNELLDENLHPVGSMDVEIFENMRRTLWSWTEVGNVESVGLSVDLIERMIAEQSSNLDPDLSELRIKHSLNYSLLNALVKNWYACWKEVPDDSTNDMMSPKEIWSKIEDWSERSENLRPQASTVITIMKSIVYRIKSIEEAEYVQSLLITMLERYRAGNNRLTPSTVEYNVVMHAFAKIGEPEHAEAILMRLTDEYKKGLSHFGPDEVSFATVLHGWKLAKTSVAGERAEAVLDFMIEYGRRANDPSMYHPNLSCYYAILRAFCDGRTKTSIRRAERFMQRMQEDFERGNEDARPNDNCYAIIINAWSQLGRGEESEHALRRMYDDYTRNGNTKAKVTCNQFNSAIVAWARSEARHAMDRAWKLFESMKEINIKPDHATYGALLHCLSRSNNPKIGQVAERLLREQRERYRNGEEACRLDALHYNAVMHCWSSLGNAVRTEELLRELLEEHKRGNLRISDDRPFNTALAAWARSRLPQRAERAQAIFEEMKRLGERGILDFRPSANSISALQGCWASAEMYLSGEKCLALLREMQKRAAAGDSLMQPKEANFKVVIDSFNRIRKPQQAEEIWFEMLKDYVEGKIDAKPGEDTCKAILTSWLISGAPDAIERTTAMMDRLAEIDQSQILELELNLNTYYLMLDICSKSSVPDIVQGAETIIRKMKEVHEAGARSPLPDTRCFNIAINCWGKSGQAERAEALFWEMYRSYTEGSEPHAKPDSFTISTVLSAWARSQSDMAPKRAEVFFDRVQKLIASKDLNGAKLDAVCYAALFNCLGNARTIEAAEKAEALLRDMLETTPGGLGKLEPTENCYFAVIKALTRVGKAERAEELLHKMADEYAKGRKDLTIKPGGAFRLVLNAWIQSDSEDAPDRAEKLLRWMAQEYRNGGFAAEGPGAHAYGNILRCWSRSGHPESGKRAENLFLDMTRLFGADHKAVQECSSDLVCALARSGNIESAETLLLRMSEDFLKRNRVASHKKPRHPGPEVRAFVAVLAAFTKNHASDGTTALESLALRVGRLIQLMRDIDSIKNPKLSNTVLDYWNSLSSGFQDQRVQTFLSHMEMLDSQVIDVNRRPSNARQSDEVQALKF